jgi:hypothetical protein
MRAVLKDLEVFSADGYIGKNGKGCNVILINKEERSRLELNVSGNDADIAMDLIGETVNATIDLQQSKFGDRIRLLGLELVS